jgi:NAD(P)-dependent dehydrogenase (short-subunit alcohol dehydrogenase family)
VFRTNALGTFLSLRAELAYLVEQGKGGVILNVGSIAGMTGLAGNPAYVASKHAVNGLTRNAAIDYAPYGIRVNSVNMAATDTPMVARAGAMVAASMKSSQGPMMLPGRPAIAPCSKAPHLWPRQDPHHLNFQYRARQRVRCVRSFLGARKQSRRDRAQRLP